MSLKSINFNSLIILRSKTKFYCQAQGQRTKLWRTKQINKLIDLESVAAHTAAWWIINHTPAIWFGLVLCIFGQIFIQFAPNYFRNSQNIYLFCSTCLKYSKFQSLTNKLTNESEKWRSISMAQWLKVCIEPSQFRMWCWSMCVWVCGWTAWNRNPRNTHGVLQLAISPEIKSEAQSESLSIIQNKRFDLLW